MEYDDVHQLARYVWNHYSRLLTEFEQKVATAMVYRLKNAAAGHKLKPMLDPEIDAALADGVDAYRQQVAERIMSEHGSEVFINRCPSCSRIVRTPEARQCFWCGFDWHDQRVNASVCGWPVAC